MDPDQQVACVQCGAKTGLLFDAFGNPVSCRTCGLRGRFETKSERVSAVDQRIKWFDLNLKVVVAVAGAFAYLHGPVMLNNAVVVSEVKQHPVHLAVHTRGDGLLALNGALRGFDRGEEMIVLDACKSGIIGE